MLSGFLRRPLEQESPFIKIAVLENAIEAQLLSSVSTQRSKWGHILIIDFIKGDAVRSGSEMVMVSHAKAISNRRWDDRCQSLWDDRCQSLDSELKSPHHVL
jgi:hypothetical protein